MYKIGNYLFDIVGLKNDIPSKLDMFYVDSGKQKTTYYVQYVTDFNFL